MLPSDLLKAFFALFVLAPAAAAVVVFKGPPVVRQVARYVLLVASLAHSGAVVAFLKYAFAKPSSGIGNGVFLLLAIPVGLFAIFWFAFWRAARRYEYEQSLSPDLRRAEELEDIEGALEAARRNLESAERRVGSWLIGSEERQRLRDQIELLKSAIANLEQERAKRLLPNKVQSA
jgi:hypothetical protein